MRVITNPSAMAILCGMTTKYGLQYDVRIARHTLSNALDEAARLRDRREETTWRWVAARRIWRCRAAVRKVEMELADFVRVRCNIRSFWGDVL